MPRRPRRNHRPVFKAKVALAAVHGEQTLAEFAQLFDVHLDQIKQWKNRRANKSGGPLLRGRPRRSQIFEIQDVQAARA